MKTILIIDDDLHIGNMLEEILRKEGYGVLRAYSGTEALLVLSKETPDLILLDLMLPKIKEIPVIVMSAKADVNHKASLLLEGAADYVTKPFHVKELLARIVVQLRDRQNRKETSYLFFDDLKLCTDTHIVTVNEKEVKLTRTEFAILKLLMKNPAQIITKSALLEQISEDTPDCMESSLKVHISNLRKKLREGSEKEYIEAVWGIGFKMKSR